MRTASFDEIPSIRAVNGQLELVSRSQLVIAKRTVAKGCRGPPSVEFGIKLSRDCVATGWKTLENMEDDCRLPSSFFDSEHDLGLLHSSPRHSE